MCRRHSQAEDREALDEPQGTEAYSLGGIVRLVKKYRVHIELGSVTGVVARIIGKQRMNINI